MAMVQGQGFPLGENRAVINRSLYRLLSPSETLPFTVEIPFQMEDGSRILRKVEVVGVCEDLSEVAPYYNSEGILCAQTQIYVSQSLFSTEELPRLRYIFCMVCLSRESSESPILRPILWECSWLAVWG